MPNQFNFYQAAYKINQGYGGLTIPTSSIKMGSITSPLYRGLAFYLTKTFYADLNSVEDNKLLFNTRYFANFDSSIALKFHSAEYLANCDFGPVVPELNQISDNFWDQVCYPSALGDTRENIMYDPNIGDPPGSEFRNGSWVEAGYVSGPGQNKNYINIYTADPLGGSPIWLNSYPVTNTFEFQSRNTRVFTSPSFTSDFVPGISPTPPSGTVLIAYFAWSTIGNNGNPILYYELFGWDVGSNIISSINNGVDLTTTALLYDEFQYNGKHDIFHTAKLLGGSPHNYDLCPHLMIFTNGAGSSPKLVQLDVATAAVRTTTGVAGAYDDSTDIFAYADNVTRSFYTLYGRFGKGGPPGTDPLHLQAIGGTLNIFDADYKSGNRGAGTKTSNDEAFTLAADYFYFAEDRQSLNGTIVGWSLKFDKFGIFSTKSRANTITGSYTLKRAVLVAPMELIVGPGPGIGGQDLIRITCDYDDGSGGSVIWYKAGAVNFYFSSGHEDYIAMDHGWCEDWTNYFHPSGYYTSGYESGLPVGAGNRHILSVNGFMGTSLINHNTTSTYLTEPYSGTPSDHYNYSIYLGMCSWNAAAISPHNGVAYLYINVTGGSISAPFLNPTSGLGFNTVFTGPGGRLRMMLFYA